MSPRPPRLARWLLLLIPAPEREFVEGDLEEEFAARVPRGRQAADAWYWRQVLLTVPAIAPHIHLPRRNPAMTSSATPRKPAFGSLLLASRPKKENRFATGLVSATLHGALLVLAVRATAGQGNEGGWNEPEVVEITSAMTAPPPPPPPPVDAPSALRSLPTVMVPPNVIPQEIPPPGESRITEELIYSTILAQARDTTSGGREEQVVAIGEKPSFTPYTVAPEMRNRDEVARALEREYPPMLRDTGIGGRVEVWIRLDEKGVLQDAQVKVSSGHPTLDEAALRVARITQFTPALNRDKAVPVWVSIPITFQVR